MKKSAHALTIEPAFSRAGDQHYRRGSGCGMLRRGGLGEGFKKGGAAESSAPMSHLLRRLTIRSIAVASPSAL